MASVRNTLTLEGATSDTPATQIVRSVINSGVDVDKLAYVIDDARFTGVPFGLGVDVEGLMRSIIVGQHNDEYGIAFEFDALPAIESLCFARYWNFQRIYWNRDNRSIATMIIWTVRELSSHEEWRFEEFLERTFGLGEASALNELTAQYRSIIKKDPPIAKLPEASEAMYACIYEDSFIGKQDLLNDSQNSHSGPNARRNACVRASTCILEKIRPVTGINALAPDEVLLDVPLRHMTLGGNIFIKNREGAIVDASEHTVSPLLSQLKGRFAEMSSTLRIYVSPRVRKAIGGSWDTIVPTLHQPLMRSISGHAQHSESQ